MKILFAGQFKESSLENHYLKYLQPLAEVATYPAEDVFDDYYWPSLWNKLKFKAGVSSIYEKIAQQLVEKAEEFQPDIVWVFKGMRILPKALQQLRSMGIALANYNPDHPFQFSGTGSGNQNVTNSIGLYDLHFCYDHRVALRIEQEFGTRTAMLPFAYELSDEVFEKTLAGPEVNAACFIGYCDELRVAQVLQVAGAGIPVHVYGARWAKMTPGSTRNITVHPPVYHEDFWKTMRRYRLQLNFFRPHNIGSHNMRSFEVPAVGGIMLAPDSPDHWTFFEPGKEIFVYQNQEGLVAMAREILAMSAPEAAEVRRLARQRSVASGYSYQDRSNQAFASFTAHFSPLSPAHLSHPL